jgi:ABC-type uncharacterized transport system YnjBCD substrate-binding protein
MMRAGFSTIAIGLIVTSAALAGDLEDKKAKKSAEEATAKALTSLSDAKACGKNAIKVSIDWDSFKDAYVHCAPECSSSGKRETTPQSVGDYPQSVLAAIASSCTEDPDGFKPAFLAKVKTMTFKYDKTATFKNLEKGANGDPNAGPRFELKNGTLGVGVNWETSNISTETSYWLKKHL